MAAPMLDTYREVVTPEGVASVAGRTAAAGHGLAGRSWRAHRGTGADGDPAGGLDEFGSGLNLC
jgi:hypothetical protein